MKLPPADGLPTGGSEVYRRREELDTELLTDDLDLLEAGGFSSGEVFLRSYLATYTDVELDLGLRARGTDGYLRSVSCLILESLLA